MARPIKTCANCGAWQEPSSEEAMGQCRANPPTLCDDNSAAFPPTPPHWWCGKWISQRRLAAVEKEEV